jgi:hypothetical protein
MMMARHIFQGLALIFEDYLKIDFILVMKDKDDDSNDDEGDELMTLSLLWFSDVL